MPAVEPKPRDGVPLLGVGPRLDEEAEHTLLAELELLAVAEVRSELPGLVGALVDGGGGVLDELPPTEGVPVGCATLGADGPHALSTIMRPAAAAAAAVV